MLYADKRNLELNLQVALLGIRNKELHFYTENLIAIGTQAALLGLCVRRHHHVHL